MIYFRTTMTAEMTKRRIQMTPMRVMMKIVMNLTQEIRVIRVVRVVRVVQRTATTLTKTSWYRIPAAVRRYLHHYKLGHV